MSKINITYSEFVSVALVIEHATRMRHIINCEPSGYTKFFHIIQKTAKFSKKKKKKKRLNY